MVFIEWRKEFETGFSGIDFEHQTLIEAINELHSQIKTAQIDQGGDSAETLRRLGDIHALIEQHFALEERIMREEGFQRYPEHKADHAKLLDEILDISDDFRKGQSVDLETALGERVRDWFSNHFATFDRDFHVWEQHEKQGKANP